MARMRLLNPRQEPGPGGIGMVEVPDHYIVTLRFRGPNGEVTTSGQYTQIPYLPYQDNTLVHHSFRLVPQDPRMIIPTPETPDTFEMTITQNGQRNIIILGPGHYAELEALDRVLDWHWRRMRGVGQRRARDDSESDFGSIQYWKRKAATKKNWNSKVVDRFYGLYSNAR